MSVPTTVQSKSVPLLISTDGVSYKSIVCKRTFNFQATKAVNNEETDCGIEKGLGAIDWTMDFEGVLNTTPNGATEASFAEVAQHFLNDVLLYVKTQTGDGSGGNMYISGRAYVTDFATQNSVGNLQAFTATFNGVGDPDFTV